MKPTDSERIQPASDQPDTEDTAASGQWFSFRHFLAVLAARNREFIRDRSSWAWNVIFPVMLIAGLAVMFGNDNRALYKIGVYPAVDKSDEFFAVRHLQFVTIENLEKAVTAVERHQYDLLIDTESSRYWINTTSPSGYIAERILLSGTKVGYQREQVTGKQVRYVDWVIPGVLGMNMMFTCLFGVGYVIVRYRKSGVLKRLKATPLAAVEFLAAQVVSRLWLVMAITLTVFIGTHLILDFTMHGSYLSLFVVLVIGAIALINMGLLVAARTASEELAGGLLNLFTWPMMMMSGVWFSLEGAHPLIRSLANLLPLTQIVDAARRIMIDGASLFDVSGSLLYLVVFAIVCVMIGARMFRWE